LTRPRDRRTRPGKLAEPAATKPQRPPEPEAAPFSITLRDIEIPAPPPAVKSQRSEEELVRSDPEARLEPWLGDPDAERAAQRTARRAQVRKDRLRDAMPEADFPPTESQAVGLHPPPHADPVPTLRAMPSAVNATPLVSEVPTLRDALPSASDVPPLSTVPAARATPQPGATPHVGAAPAASPTPPQAVSEPAPDKGAAAPAILVLRAIGDDPDPLCEQLKAFGFHLEVRRDPPDLPAPWPFVAVFIDHALRIDDGGDAIDLCNEVRERSRLPGVLKPVLVLVADQLSATNRVRAGLAGCNEIVLGAITRGSVAKVLDTRGIALPSDARRV
jgi:hypothetical protein